jgi:hypothetical protein
MTPAGHDGSLERPLFRERALLMRACVINGEEAPVGVGHRDAAASDFEEGQLTWLDGGFLGEGYGSCIHVGSFRSARWREASAGPQDVGVPVRAIACISSYFREGWKPGLTALDRSSFKMKEAAFDLNVSR